VRTFRVNPLYKRGTTIVSLSKRETERDFVITPKGEYAARWG
jgi:hypothetical protein